MMQRFLLVSVLVLSCLNYCHSQQFPFYTQYFFNPYSINPAFIASTQQAEINGTFRRQWSGIQDGPQTLQFDVQYPINIRMAIGLNLYEDKTVLLSSTTAMFTYGYKVPIAANHLLGFGLSGGIVSNRIRVNEIPDADATDPAILNALDNNFSFDGQFGAYYNYKNFNLGFSLVRLVENKTFAQEQFQSVKFSQLQNRIIFASYRAAFLAETWFFQPNFTYHIASDNLNFYEASAVVSYKNIIEAGGGFRENFGPSMIGRLHLRTFEIGFAFDFPSNNYEISTQGTNEIQLKWRFGKKFEPPLRREKKIRPVLLIQQSDSLPVKRETEKQASVQEEIVTTNSEKEDKPQEQEPVISNPVEQTPRVEEIAEKREEYVGPPTIGDDEHFFLVIGSFRKKNHAESLVRSIRKDGFLGEIRKDEGLDLYYVHLPSYKTKQINLENINQFRKDTPFTDAWFKRMKDE